MKSVRTQRSRAEGAAQRGSDEDRADAAEPRRRARRSEGAMKTVRTQRSRAEGRGAARER
jgi:hypothetical protein